MSERVLTCDGVKSCDSEITHIDEKGFIYCANHGKERQEYRRCRKLAAWELRLIEAGQPVPSYTPVKRNLTWIPAAVGCYWNAEEFTVGTATSYRDGKAVLTFPDSAYVLTRNREEVGRFKSLGEAQRMAGRYPKVEVSA